jgi:hypothetical protein
MCRRRSLNASQATSTPERHLIASGSSENNFDICIWEKPVSNCCACERSSLIDDSQTKQAICKSKKKGRTATEGPTMLQAVLVFLLLYLMLSQWMPSLVEVSHDHLPGSRSEGLQRV